MTDQPPQPRTHRIARIISHLVCLAVAAWIAWIAVTRWNGTPADPNGSALVNESYRLTLPIAADRDRTEELLAALQALPPLPNLTLPPPPANMRWISPRAGPITPYDAIAGEWTPDTRLHLQAVIQYLEDPDTQAAFDRLAAIEPGGWRPFNRWRPGLGTSSQARAAAKLIAARARYHHAHRNNLDAAIGDLEMGYRLAGIIFDSGDRLGVITATGLAQVLNLEATHLAREQDLTSQQAARLLDSLQTHTPDRRRLWQQLANDERAGLSHMLDLCWTDDGRGNGWLAVNHLNGLILPGFRTELGCGAWNVLSILFNDRQMAEAKIARHVSQLESLADLPFEEANRIVNERSLPCTFGLTDGPLGNVINSLPAPGPWTLYHYAASYQATRAALALSAYRHDHGQYPDSLADLTQTCLPEVPLDPFVNQPLSYEKVDRSYLLYSLGPDLDDDHGRERIRGAGVKGQPPDGDLAFSQPRPDPRCEPHLEPL